MANPRNFRQIRRVDKRAQALPEALNTRKTHINLAKGIRKPQKGLEKVTRKALTCPEKVPKEFYKGLESFQKTFRELLKNTKLTTTPASKSHNLKLPTSRTSLKVIM